MRTQVLAALTLTLAVAAALPAGDAVRDDLKRLQGDWTVSVMEEHGKNAPEDICKELLVRIKADTLTLLDKGKVSVELRFKLDPAQNPKAVDFTYLSGVDKGQKELGVYLLDDDTVKFCVNEKGKERPKVFTTARDNALNLLVLKRKK